MNKSGQRSETPTGDNFYLLVFIFYLSSLTSGLVNNSSITFKQASWKRLKKNKGAIFGLVIIIFAILVAIFAYFIAPDPSPFANRIILEIGGAKPGYTQTFLKVKKVKSIASTSFFTHLVDGKEDAFYFVPHFLRE